MMRNVFLRMTMVCLVSFTATVSAIKSPAARAEQISLDVSLAQPTMLVGEKQTNYLKIKLNGFDLAANEKRTPVNVAIVMDKSGSMSGEKMEQAKKAALTAVDRLRDNDIVSVIVYDHNVTVLVPATRASDRESIRAAIENIQASGNTALFAGVSKGAAEVRKFLDDKHVNRVILLSDGLANVGPSSPAELEQLGQALLKEGVSVSSLGLGTGYNEDLMTSLAAASSGNHVFIENADNLIAVFNNEFDDLLSVVASDIELKIHLSPEMRPVRMLGTPADIHGPQVRWVLGQLYARQERYFILEVEMTSGENNSERLVGDVNVSYRNMHTQTKDRLASQVNVRFSDSTEKVEADTNVEALAFSALQLAAERNREATALRDSGKIEEAKKLLAINSAELGRISIICKINNFACPDIELGCTINKLQSEQVGDTGNWNVNRKRMREYQSQVTNQQSYGETGKNKK